MIYKYKVPKDERFRYDDKKVIYCRIKQVQKMALFNDLSVCRVEMMNLDNMTNLFLSKDLKRLNLIDRIKVKFL